jgi:hypothetical protein
MTTESKGLMNNVATVIIIVVANVVISYIMANRVANTTVIQDNVKIEFLQAQAKVNADNIAKLDEHIIGKENFNSAVLLLKEQNDITRQMIIAHERSNISEFRKLQDQYDILKDLLDRELSRYRNTQVTGGKTITP